MLLLEAQYLRCPMPVNIHYVGHHRKGNIKTVFTQRKRSITQERSHLNEVYENSFLKAKREDDAFMTVGKLRAHLEGIPDSATVSLGALSSNQSVHYLAITTNLFPETLSTTNKLDVKEVVLCEVHVSFIDKPFMFFRNYD